MIHEPHCEQVLSICYNLEHLMPDTEKARSGLFAKNARCSAQCSILLCRMSLCWAFLLSFFVTSTSEASFSDVSNPIFSITLNSQDFSSFALTLQDLLKRPQELHTSAPL